MRPSRLYSRLPSVLPLFILFSPALTFNVDTVTSTVHRGPEDSMFGFAIAQYKHGGSSWLIIGAPKAQTNQPGVNQGGAVYRCMPEFHNRCQQIPFDQEGSYEKTVEGRRYETENKSGQWFGATVQTSGEDGAILACAPRYVYFGSNWSKREPVGVCWVTNGDFSSTNSYSPCKDHLGYYKQGYCQAGLSAALTKNGERLYIGAVGSWHWQGQVFSQSLIDDNIAYETKESPQSSDDSYLGYSAAAGEFTGDNDMDVVAGMPKHNIIGMVLLYDSTLNSLLNISGEQTGSYFGYSVCVADINGDKLDDIVIGAPLFSTFEAKRGKYEEGRVYIIYQTSEHLFHGMVHLDGTRSKGRFGLALTSLGDINKDEYQDFAVGAPYGGEDGNGAVFIYHGSPEGVRKKASQVIEPKDFGHSGISTFGFSLSGGMDLDNNHYPDLLVGAYESDSVIHFRSRPVVNITAELKTSLEYISLEEKTCSLKGEAAVTCFDFSLSLEYTGLGVEQELDFVYQLTLDSTKDEPRVFFLSEGNITKRNISVTLHKDLRHYNSSNYVYVQPKIRDKLTPITVSLKYFLVDPHPFRNIIKPIVNQDVPNEILKRVNILKNCGKDNECFPDLQLDVIPNMDTFVIEDKRRLELNVLVSNIGEDAFEAMFYLSMPLDVNFIRINETKTDFLIACTGAQPETGVNELVCDIGNPLPAGTSLQFRVVLEPSGIISSIDEFVFSVTVNSSNVEFANRTFDNYQEIHLPVKVEADVELHGDSDPEVISYNKSQPVPTIKVEESDIGPKVLHSYKIINRGPSTIKKALVYILWPSYNPRYEPLLYLMDQPSIKGRNAKCEVIDDVNPLGVQKEVKDHKKQSFLNINDMRDKKPDNVDESHPLSEIFEKRRRRAVQLLSLLEEELQCGEIICTQIACSISNLKKDQEVVFKMNSRLWRESVNKLGLEEVQISSKMVVAVTEFFYNVDPTTLPIKSAKVSTKVQLADVPLKSSEFPWWIIMLAVCGGLLLLGLLALLLWKLGFFERKRPQEEPEKVPLQKNGYQMARGDEAL